MGTVMVRSIGHTGITVSDLDRSMHFYQAILGFEVSPKVRIAGPFFETLTGVAGCVIEVAFARGGGHTIELLRYHSPSGSKTSDLRACDPGSWHLCLKVQDIERVVRAVRESGYEALSAIQTAVDPPVTGVRVVYVRDPDGIVLELLEEPPGICLEDLYFPKD
jgi:catechol 2,3-dioxygenase-like lactoylglutathione lyase family enzyme